MWYNLGQLVWAEDTLIQCEVFKAALIDFFMDALGQQNKL